MDLHSDFYLEQYSKDRVQQIRNDVHEARHGRVRDADTDANSSLLPVVLVLATLALLVLGV